MTSRTPFYPAIPMLYTRGTHYEVGYNIGLTFADRIHKFWNESTEVNTVDLPYSRTPDGQKFYNETLEACKNSFPQYVRELEGMSAGSGLEFRQMFILNLSKEVHNVLHYESQTPPTDLALRQVSEDSGCSDVFLNTPGCKILAHNEDCDPQIKPYGFLVKARIVEDGEEVESFTSYCYPGVLPGTTVSFNKHGLYFTVDGLYSATVARGAPTRMFLNRSVIRAKTVEEAVRLAKNPGFGCAYGFTLNVADVNRPESLWSIEVAPKVGESIVHLHEVREEDPTKSESGYYLHFNCYKHNDNVAQIPNRRSSSQRARTAESYPVPTNQQDILKMLGDTSHAEYPIYRTDRPSDPSETIYTAVLDVLDKRVHFYQGNPSQEGLLPLMSFNAVEE